MSTTEKADSGKRRPNGDRGLPDPGFRPWAGSAEDLRFALRLLLRRPLTVLFAVASIGLGIALCAVMLAVLHAAWIQTIPYSEPDRLVDLRAARAGRPDSRFGLSSADFVAWREATTDVFESMGAYLPFGSFDLTGNGEPVRLERDLATAGVFEALGTPPLLGRTFVEDDERPGAARVVVLSHGLWQGRFGGDPGVVGRSITLDGTPHVVVGVMPRAFGVQGGTPDLWAPLSFGEQRPVNRRTYDLVGVARLRDAVTFEQAGDRLSTVSRQVSIAADPPQNEEQEADLVIGLTRPLGEVMTATIRPLLTLLLGAVLLVLLMMALNVANLLTVLRLGRRQEIAVRRVLGASGLRLGRQTLVEGLFIALLGGLAGTLGGVAGAALLPDLRDTFLHRFVDVEINAWVVGLSLLLSLAAAVVVGVLPTLAVPLRRIEGFSCSTGARVIGNRVSLSVVVLQTALCMLLLVAAGITLRSVQRLQSADLGYRHVETLAADIDLPRARYPSGERAVDFHRRLLERVSQAPTVEAAALSSGVPGSGWGFGPDVRGRSDDPEVSARWLAVSPAYFETIGLELVEGRSFAELGTRNGIDAPRVAILNESAARRLFRGASPLGESITLDGPEHWYEIVGVVGDVRRDLATSPRPAGYFLLDQVLRDVSIEEVALRESVLLVRGRADGGSSEALRADVGAALHEIDPLIPLTAPATLEERAARTLTRPRMSSGLLSLFGGIALALAALGLYGLMSLAVRLRGRELAVRLALGAHPRELMTRVVAHGLALTGAGIGAGLLLAWALRERLGALSPLATEGIAQLDRGVLLAAPAALLAVGLLASWIPARRILAVDPVRSLREE